MSRALCQESIGNCLARAAGFSWKSRTVGKRAVTPDVTVITADCHQICEQSLMDERAFDMAACVEQVRQKDEDAARVFMERLYPLVLKVVRAHSPRRMSEEDLVQTVFMKVFVNLGQYSGRVPVEHWVSRIAVNTCFNALKAERARPEWRWSDLSEEEQHVVESLAASQEESRTLPSLAARDLLDRLMASLNPEDRLVIRLLYLEERSVADIAQMTGWSVAVVKVRAFRARKKLQKYLNKLTKEERR